MVKKFNLQRYIHHLKNPNKSILQKQIKEEITDSDLVRYFGKNDFKNIIKYSQLDDYTTIQQLLPGPKSWKIILVESSYNSGHWICIFRNKKTITVFNSYGGFPSSEINYIEDKINKQLGQDKRYLNMILENGLSNKFNIVYNKRALQKLEDGVNTCGKWVILFIMMFENYDMNLYEFICFIDNLKKLYKLSSDEIVSLLIQK